VGRRERATAAVISLGAHVAIVLIGLLSWRAAEVMEEPAAVSVEMIEDLPPAPAPPKKAPIGPPAPAKAKSTPKKAAVRASRARPSPAPRPAEAAFAPGDASELSDAELAGAASVGSGGGGGGGGGECDMARRLQNALRRDPLVISAMAQANAGGPRRAVLVWRGDWVQSRGEDGKGLAAVREAILWEVGFAPKACRAQVVHGLIQVSLGDAPGLPRLVLGAPQWRWSDLLAAR
jgi:hypothetical protein